MNHQLIFEIGTEEIPAGYLLPALDKLKENFTSGLAALNLTHGDMKGVATPRRLTVCVEELLDHQPDKVEELMGPPKKAAFDAAGKPTKAAIGFAKSRGANLDDIQVVSTAKGEYLMIRQEQKGRATRELLAELLPKLIESIPFPKSMRWGASRTTFARGSFRHPSPAAAPFTAWRAAHPASAVARGAMYRHVGNDGEPS